MNVFLHSDGTAQHFKYKYYLCTMTLVDGNVEWDFSATSHGKGDIDGLSVTCKQRVHEKSLPAPSIHKTLLSLLNVLLLCVVESQFFIALKQMLKKLKQHIRNPDALTMGWYIPFQVHEKAH